jgi:ATP-dependent HslUV protease ATP-binding subunit HslU
LSFPSLRSLTLSLFFPLHSKKKPLFIKNNKTAEDFYRILTEPEANMLQQQRALLATEGVELRFTDGAARAIAEAAAEANAALDNIGARRLHTVLERVLELVSFDAPETAAKARAEAAAAARDSSASASSATAVVEVDEEFVKERMGDLLQRQDLSRYVL